MFFKREVSRHFSLHKACRLASDTCIGLIRGAQTNPGVLEQHSNRVIPLPIQREQGKAGGDAW